MSIYQCVFIVIGLVGLFQGFIFTSKGSLFKNNERLKTGISIVFHCLCFSMLISAFLERSWIIAVIDIAFYFLAPGTGQTVAGLLLHEKQPLLSWILSALYFVLLICIIIGRVIYA